MNHWHRRQLAEAKKHSVEIISMRGSDLHEADRHCPRPGDDNLLANFLRHWNRIPRRVRIDAAELIAQAGGEEIEP